MSWQSAAVNQLKIGSGCLLGQTVKTRTLAGLRLCEAIYSGKERLPRHEYERPFLYLVLKGLFDEHYPGRSIMVEPGAAVFQPADTPHSNAFRAEEVRCFHVEFTEAWDARLSGCPALLNHPGFWRGGEPAWLAERLFRESRNFDEAAALAVEGLALEFLAAAARGNNRTNHDFVLDRMDKVRDFIQSNFAEAISHEQIAREMDVPAARLAKAFRLHFGCGMGEFLRRCRVDHARRRLAKSEASLAEIALESGFYDQAHFTRVFRRFLGTTPAAYRRQSREM